MGNAAKMLRFYERKAEDERRIRNREPWTDNELKDEILRDSFGPDFLADPEDGGPYWGPDSYWQDIFGNYVEPLFIDINKEKHKHFKTSDFVKICENHKLDETFVHYCSFLNDCKKDKTIDQIFAFVVDLDNVNANDLSKIINWKMKSKLRPTFIVNSGHGLHLIYQLTEPFTRYHKDRNAVANIYRKLQSQWHAGKNDGYHVDYHGLTQAYRFPGALNKLGRIVKVWRIGARHNIKTLAERYGVKVMGKIINFQKKSNKKDVSHTKHHKTGKGLKKGVDAFPNAKLYKWMRNLIYEEVHLGHRYTALFALAVCGVKSRVPEDLVKTDMEEMVDLWNMSYPGQPVKRSEIKKALGAYKNRKESVRARRIKLEEWTGVPIAPAKRNGRSQKDHLARINVTRSAKAKSLVEMYVKANPGAPMSQLAEVSGLHRNTIGKYVKILKSEGRL